MEMERKPIKDWCEVEGMNVLEIGMLRAFARRVGIFDETRVEKRVFEALVLVFADRIVENAK